MKHERARGVAGRGRWIEVGELDAANEPIFAFCDEQDVPLREYEPDGEYIRVMGTDNVYDIVDVLVRQRDAARARIDELEAEIRALNDSAWERSERDRDA